MEWRMRHCVETLNAETCRRIHKHIVIHFIVMLSYCISLESKAVQMTGLLPRPVWSHGVLSETLRFTEYQVYLYLRFLERRREPARHRHLKSAELHFCGVCAHARTRMWVCDLTLSELYLDSRRRVRESRSIWEVGIKIQNYRE